ncbi:glycosyltransferase 87 family protein [Umezawaea sp. Da 62-37]|uniref:glycosyltransferase 87 family protein n=1 Tax=Umezawaea sp. Da 62-37 TaxID=3075927 RepID=UPI0028F6CF45|nr:glycosyltransferase 87 family protein [Umezawaea sp. Da 62-37]WNV85001.1 glycosyltransferase 87 family protein [Umezawaea sp. Da 62-37]
MTARADRRPLAVAALVALVLGCAVLGTWFAVLVNGDKPDWLEDLAVYVGGGRAVTDGKPLYQLVVPPFGYQFTYPPFAAVLFVPLSLVGAGTLKILWTFVNVLLVEAVVLLSLRWVRPGPARQQIALVAVVALAAMWLGPVRATLETGQVNLLLVVLVLMDFALLSRSKAMGVGIGLAMAVKLTPGVFLVYLLLTRRFRAALTAAVTFLATVLFSLAVLPSDTLKYWGGVFVDADRVAITQHRFQQSLRGVVVRVAHSTDTTLVWACLAVVLAVLGLALAVGLWRRGQDQWGVLVTAGVALVVSPVSWEHHWVWVVPGLVFLAAAVRTPLGWAGWGVVVAAIALRPYAWAVPRDPADALRIDDPLTQIAASWLPLLAVLVAVALAVTSRASRTSGVSTPTGAELRSDSRELRRL